MKIKIDDGQIREFDVENGDHITVGSLSDNDIVIDKDAVGERHLEIIVKNTDIFVVDLGSGKPSFVDDDPLVPGKEVVMNSFFPVTIGDIKISIEDDVIEQPFIDELSDISEEDMLENKNFASELDSSGVDGKNSSKENTGSLKNLSDEELITQIKQIYKKQDGNTVKKNIIGSHLEFEETRGTPR